MIEVGIVGGTGYTGAELLRLLSGHPDARVRLLTSRQEAGHRADALFPQLRGRVGDLVFTEPDPVALAQCQAVFFATPHGTAMQMAPKLLERGVKVLDLSADFRLKNPATFRQWYQLEHASPKLLGEAVYGLPELNRDTLRGAHLVACPGCYPTAVELGFLPLIEQALGQVAGEAVSVTFVPHLVPMNRGIHATLYADLERDTDLQALYQVRYSGEPFVDVLPPAAHPETRSVRGANTCRIAVHRPRGGRRVVILAVIDNLVKGAAGQAVQCFNLMFGLDEAAGLGATGLWP